MKKEKGLFCHRTLIMYTHNREEEAGREKKEEMIQDSKGRGEKEESKNTGCEVKGGGCGRR